MSEAPAAATARQEGRVLSPDELRAELVAARAETDALFRLVSEADLYERPLPQRHRLIFYLGHLDAFDWNQAGRFGLGEPHVDASLDTLFERGIDPEPGQLPPDQVGDWPSVAQTDAYIATVRNRLDELWPEVPLDLQQTAVEHRWMHAETLAYLFHNLPPDKKRKPPTYAPVPSRPALVDHRFITIPAGVATLGRERGSGFGWDNEFEQMQVNVPEFAIGKYKITNGDFLEFVNEGHEPPFFWAQRDGTWFFRGIFDMLPLPLEAPVYVTQKQATAYAAWRGAHLPTEAQYHRATFATPEGFEQEMPWGSDLTHPEAHGNFDFNAWDPVAVTEYPGGRSAFGVAQPVGNGWEWTSSPFAPFPGFKPSPNYPGYSADFFDGQHFVMKGASPRTAKLLTRRSLRNWFRPDYPYMYGTFRLVEN